MSKGRELRDVVNSISAYVWSMSPDGTVDFVNERWREFTGLSLDDTAGWSWEMVVHPEDRSRFVANWRRALENETLMETEVRMRRADGDYRWWSVRNVPLRDELGKVANWYGTGIDIEDRRLAESLLAGEKRIFEMVAKGDSLSEVLSAICRLIEERASGVLASILLLDGNRLWHGAAPSLPKAYADAIDGAPIESLASTTAYSDKEVTDRLYAHYLHVNLPLSPLPVSEGAVIVEDISTDPRWAQYRHLALPHSLRACWSMPVFSSGGKVIATFAMYYSEPRSPSSRDLEIVAQITHLAGAAIELKLTLEALRRSESYRAEAERLTHTGSWAFRRDRAIYWSEELFRLWGLDPQKGLPDRDTLWQRIHPEDRDKAAESSVNAVHSGKDYTLDYRIVLPDGTVRHMRGFGHPVFSSSGDPIEIVGSAIDVTESKRVEQERHRLRQLEADLAHINRVSMMGELAAALAHELNQPLSGVVVNGNACLRWLAGDPPNLEEARENVRRIVRDAKRAGDIIARVRAQTTKTATTMARLDMNEAIKEVIGLAQPQLLRNNVALRVELPADLSPVLGDRVQLQQVVLNLVINAVEAMSTVVERPRELVIRTQNDEADLVRITVQDSGIGLDPQGVERIFDAFYTTKSGGMGIGLSICRSIVQNHRGRLWAVANDGPGTTLEFTVQKYDVAARNYVA